MATRAKRTADAHERQAAIIQLRNQGLRYRDIAAQYGIREQRVHQIWKAGIQRIGEPVIRLERSRALEVRDLALRKLWTKEQNPPPSKVIQHKNGTVETFFDPDYHTRVMGEIRKWEEHSARLLGLYQASVNLQVETSSAVANSHFVATLRAMLIGGTALPVEPASELPAIETQATEVAPEAPIQQSEAGVLRNLILAGSHGD